MQAVIGLSLIDERPAIFEKRNRNFLELGGSFRAGTTIVPHGFPVFYESKQERDAKLLKLDANGIECRKIFSCIPTDEKAYAFMGHKRGEFPEAERIADTGLYVPCHQNLTEEDLNAIRAHL